MNCIHHVSSYDLLPGGPVPQTLSGSLRSDPQWSSKLVKALGSKSSEPWVSGENSLLWLIWVFVGVPGIFLGISRASSGARKFDYLVPSWFD
jgi:predicted branched-subunit amino acid permease